MFIDVIFLYFKTNKEHARHLRIVLEVLREQKLYANISTCKLWLKEVSILGHVISRGGISVNSSKVDAALQWETHMFVYEIKGFLRFVGYYRRIKEGFSRLTL